ncbi:MAG: hypothetical protein IJB94_07535 [Clostridia bacterium]|nr:hypothetical protein [Clostridia bacterium]
MIAFLTSSPCIYGAPRAILNPENGFVDNLRSCLPENPRCLFVASAPNDIAFTDRVAEEMAACFYEAGLGFSELTRLDRRNQADARLLLYSAFLKTAGPTGVSVPGVVCAGVVGIAGLLPVVSSGFFWKQPASITATSAKHITMVNMDLSVFFIMFPPFMNLDIVSLSAKLLLFEWESLPSYKVGTLPFKRNQIVQIYEYTYYTTRFFSCQPFEQCF